MCHWWQHLTDSDKIAFWSAIATFLGIFIAVALGFIQLRKLEKQLIIQNEQLATQNKQLITQQFSDYTKRYQEIVLNFPENINEQWGITRQEQDEFGLRSQERALAAIASGRFKDEIIPVVIKTRKGETVFDTDEFPRKTDIEKLGSLKPSFKKDGSVTAGNASGINDGAGACVVMSKDKADALGVKPLARIVSYASGGVDPKIMGVGPIPATRKALEKAGLTVDDLDLIEANEAFAAQSIAVGRELGWVDKMDKVNVNGGAIAIGHPIGASGTRILVSLLYEMQKRQSRYGLATLCIGGGMGTALVVERI